RERRRTAADGRVHRAQPAQDRGHDPERQGDGGAARDRWAGGAALDARARAHAAPHAVRRRAHPDPGVRAARQAPPQGRLRAAGAHDHLRRHAGVRAGRRPPGRVLPRRGLPLRLAGHRGAAPRLMTAGPLPLRPLLHLRFLLARVLGWTPLRALSTVLLLVLAHDHQDPVVYDQPGVPRYFQFATLWDGAWYERIATQGYPATLPVDSTGHVRQNAWAFYPIF